MRLIDVGAMSKKTAEALAQAVIDGKPWPYREALLCAKMMLDVIPTVDAEPVRHGKWMFHNDDYRPWVTCSECGHFRFNTNKTTFCPHCGAKMDGESE